MRFSERKSSKGRLESASSGDGKDPRLVRPTRSPMEVEQFADANFPDTFDALEEAGKKEGLLGKFNARFHEALQSSRGDDNSLSAGVAGMDPFSTADDLAIRRAKSVSTQRMVVPEGVIIDGSLTSGSETEISGRVDGDVTVDGKLFLGPTALISGNVCAHTCQVEGLVEGKMECSQELNLGLNGRLNADTLAGKHINVAGQIRGNISCGGMVKLVSSAKVEGDILARRLRIEEGATFNGSCTMRRAKGPDEKAST